MILVTNRLQKEIYQFSFFERSDLVTSNLVPLIKKAKAGDESAMEVLYESFKPLLVSNAADSSKKFNQDCYQELSLQFILAVQAFDLEKYLGE